MTAEVVKPKRINLPIHMNMELVELFIETLTPDSVAGMAGKSSMSRGVKQLN
jgi:hypothetical protein